MVNKPLTNCPFKGNQREFFGAPIFFHLIFNIKVARLVCKTAYFYSFANIRGDNVIVQSPSVYTVLTAINVTCF
jgi:hypothetical protein